MEPTIVTAGYVLCASPRSGSTRLCDLLERSRVAGAPKSYFRPASIPSYAQQWGVEFGGEAWDRSYVEAVRHHGEADRGRLGMRIMGSDMRGFLERLAVLYPQAADDHQRLQLALGVRHFVHLSRDDKVAQAVSLVIAAQTGLWHLNADGSERERTKLAEGSCYDHGEIAALLCMLETEEAGWTAWLAAHAISPLVLTYEQLALDPPRQLTRVLDHLGCSAPVRPAGTAKVGSSLIREWSARFRAEASLT